MFKRKCKHKYGLVNTDTEYQYCILCGEARKVPCSHKWEEVGRIKESTFGRVVGHIWILRCAHCGDMKNHEID